MAYSSNGYRRGNNHQTSGRRPSSGSRPQNRRSRSGQGSRSTRSSRSGRGHSSANRSRSRNLTGPDTGYTLHSHRVSYSRRGGSPRDLINGRFILLLVIVIVVVVVLVAGISSCVRGSSTQASDQQTNEQTEQKPRVASGISSDLTQQFNEVLDRDDQMAQIAQNADQYDDDRLLTLALNEPEAVSFVANYLTADKSASSYTDEVTKGQVPQLYDWDTRWGYVTYGDGCIGVTGSAPTTVAMAYMGLTGKNDKTPATIAQGVSSSSSARNRNANGNSNTSNANTNNSASSNGNNSNTNAGSTGSAASDSAESMIGLMNQAGLSATQYDSSSSTLVACLSSTSVAAVYIKQDGLEDNRDAHWALVVGMNEDGSLNVFDPTSSMVSTHTWSSSTVASASSTILYVTVSDTAASSESDGTSASSNYSDYDEEDTSSTSAASNANGTRSSNGNNASGSGTSSSANSSSNSTNVSSNSGSSNSQTSTGSGNTSGSSSSGASSSGDYVGL